MRTRSLLLALATVVVLMAAPARAAVPDDGKFKGKTSQKLSITIKTKAGAIDSLLVYVKNNCGATRKPIEVGGPIEVKSDGRFSANLGGGAFRFSGRFTAAKVSGQLRERVGDPIAGGTCDTKKVTFSAQR